MQVSSVQLSGTAATHSSGPAIRTFLLQKVTHSTVLIPSAIYLLLREMRLQKKNKNMVCLSLSCHTNGEIEHIRGLFCCDFYRFYFATFQV